LWTCPRRKRPALPLAGRERNEPARSAEATRDGSGLRVELVAARAVDGRGHRRAMGQRDDGRPIEGFGAAGAFAHKRS
jgi:hypothetical protein